MEKEIFKLEAADALGILSEQFLENFAENEDNYMYFNPEGDIIYPLWLEFELILTEINYYDLEKYFESFRAIVRRISDNKYFEAYYLESNWVDYLQINDSIIEFTEVVPVQQTITVYE
jgi:hypothetical protein